MRNYPFVWLLAAATIGSVNQCLAQSSLSQNKQVKTDAVFKDRNKITIALVQLRDTLNKELEVITSMADTLSTKRTHLERALKKLKIEKGKVDQALTSIDNATKETWDYYLRETTHNLVIQTRYEYRRIKKELSESSTAHRHS